MSKEVLIVEDDRALAGMIARAVEAAGYPVRLAHDGQAALEAVARRKPGLVLLDVLLPRKDGRAVLRALRSDEETREIPVVVMSGILRTPAHALEFEQDGAQAFLPKPLARSRLVRELNDQLGPPPTAEGAEKVRDALSLASCDVADLLWGAMRRGLTGAFHFQSGKKRKVLFLDKGRPAAIRSNVVRECLGQRLLSAGRINKHALQESLRRSRAGEGRQGEILVGMGAVTEQDVEEALRHQGEEKFFELFSWNEGSVHFEPDSQAPALATLLENLSPEDSILRGVEHMHPDALERALSPLRGQKVSVDVQALPKSIRRMPEVEALGTALTAAKGNADVAIQVHAALVHALHVLGGIQAGSGKPAPAPAPESTGAGAASRAPATLAELQQLYSEQQGQTHFEVLGVKENAPTSEVKSGFFRLAKRFHPDRYGGEPEEVRLLAGEVFARISAAHEVLTEADQRAAYVETLKGEDGSAREVSQILTAEVQFQKGEALLKKKDYRRALEQFKWAIELNPEEGEFRALYGWAAYLCNPGDEKARAEARQELEKAVELSPRSVTGYYYLGRLLKACADIPSAEKMFRKAVELEPNHVEANQELRVLRMRREKESGSERKGGRFGFGRKKS